MKKNILPSQIYNLAFILVIFRLDLTIMAQDTVLQVVIYFDSELTLPELFRLIDNVVDYLILFL